MKREADGGGRRGEGRTFLLGGRKLGFEKADRDVFVGETFLLEVRKLAFEEERAVFVGRCWAWADRGEKVKRGEEGACKEATRDSSRSITKKSNAIKTRHIMIESGLV